MSEEKEPETVLDFTDEQLRSSISDNLKTMVKYDVLWKTSLVAATTNLPAQIQISGFKTLIELNKVLIKQNELILRTLSRIERKSI